MIHQNLAHQVGSDAEEVRAAFPIGQALGDQPQVGLVNQGGRLDGGSALVAEVVIRQAA